MFKPLLLAAALALSALAPLASAEPQKRTYVRGYTRKDGTYVRGYYRGAKSGSTTASGSVPQRGWMTVVEEFDLPSIVRSIHEKRKADYPCGVWLIDDYEPWSTPLVGVDADFTAKTVVVKKSTNRAVRDNWTITSYRFAEADPFLPATTWAELIDSVLEKEAKIVFIQGTNDKGKLFKSKVSLIPDKDYFPPYIIQSGTSVFYGLDRSEGDGPPGIIASRVETLPAGVIILAINDFDGTSSQFVSVKSWADIEDYIKNAKSKEGRFTLECVYPDGRTTRLYVNLDRKH